MVLSKTDAQGARRICMLGLAPVDDAEATPERRLEPIFIGLAARGSGPVTAAPVSRNRFKQYPIVFRLAWLKVASIGFLKRMVKVDVSIATNCAN